MPIFRAFGLGIFLLVLQFLVPSIFAQLQKTVISLLRAGEVSADAASQIAGSASAITVSSDPLVLPTTRLPSTP